MTHSARLRGTSVNMRLSTEELKKSRKCCEILDFVHDMTTAL